MNFSHEPNRIFLLNEEKQMLAEVTFPQINENTVEINHTYVDSSLRGQGVADELLKAVVDELLSQNKKAVPTCSYAVLWFQKHPEYSHLTASL